MPTNYSDEDYCCPNCGSDSNVPDPDNDYGVKCTECGTCFETPDI